MPRPFFRYSDLDSTKLEILVAREVFGAEVRQTEPHQRPIIIEPGKRWRRLPRFASFSGPDWEELLHHVGSYEIRGNSAERLIEAVVWDDPNTTGRGCSDTLGPAVCVALLDLRACVIALEDVARER